jgi:hypothetical protein
MEWTERGRAARGGGVYRGRWRTGGENKEGRGLIPWRSPLNRSSAVTADTLGRIQISVGVQEPDALNPYTTPPLLSRVGIS